jgi:transposase InsO family protein
VLDTRRGETREELRLAIVTWIETKHNRRRRQRARGKLTPVEFEMIYDRRPGLNTINPERQPTGGGPLRL